MLIGRRHLSLPPHVALRGRTTSTWPYHVIRGEDQSPTLPSRSRSSRRSAAVQSVCSLPHNLPHSATRAGKAVQTSWPFYRSGRCARAAWSLWPSLRSPCWWARRRRCAVSSLGELAAIVDPRPCRTRAGPFRRGSSLSRTQHACLHPDARRRGRAARCTALGIAARGGIWLLARQPSPLRRRRWMVARRRRTDQPGSGTRPSRAGAGSLAARLRLKLCTGSRATDGDKIATAPRAALF